MSDTEYQLLYLEDTGDLQLESTDTGASVSSTVSNLANSVTGAAVLTLASAMVDTGLGLGIILLLFIALMSGIAFMFIAECCTLTSQYSFKGLAANLLGKQYAVLVDLLIAVYTFGTSTAYCVALGDFFPSLFQLFLPSSLPSFVFKKSSVVIIIAVFILLPLSLLPNIDALRVTSSLSLLCPIYLIFVIVFHLVTGNIPETPDLPRGPIVWFNLSSHIFLAIPLLSVSFTAHYNVPKMINELDKRSLKKFKTVVISAIIICVVLYSLSAVTGYVTFRAATNGDILNNFDNDDLLALIAKGIMGFSIGLFLKEKFVISPQLSHFL
ncbi:hypothetical protein GEMRC1_007416 [Eukaryota sp. GEM-RC1]